MHLPFLRPFARVISFGLLSFSAFAGTLTLDLTSAVPLSPTYSGHAGTGTFSGAISALQYFTVTAQAGNPFTFPSTLALFCVELEQNISLPSTGNVFTVLSADQAAMGGPFAPKGANIPNAGIGSLRAANLERLYAHRFDMGYNPASLSDTSKVAFQLAVWELSHDDNFDLLNASPNGFSITTPVDPAISEAQAMVTWVQEHPAAPQMQLYALHNPTIQDFLTPTSFSPIPEPSAYALLIGLVAIGSAMRRRKVAAHIQTKGGGR